MSISSKDVAVVLEIDEAWQQTNWCMTLFCVATAEQVKEATAVFGGEALVHAARHVGAALIGQPTSIMM